MNGSAGGRRVPERSLAITGIVLACAATALFLVLGLLLVAILLGPPMQVIDLK